MSSKTTGEFRCARELTDTTRAPPAAAQRRQQAEGEPEVAEVVGGELQFMPFGAELELGDGHDAGVVDQDVQRTV